MWKATLRLEDRDCECINTGIRPAATHQLLLAVARAGGPLLSLLHHPARQQRHAILSIVDGEVASPTAPCQQQPSPG